MDSNTKLDSVIPFPRKEGDTYTVYAVGSGRWAGPGLAAEQAAQELAAAERAGLHATIERDEA